MNDTFDAAFVINNKPQQSHQLRKKPGTDHQVKIEHKVDNFSSQTEREKKTRVSKIITCLWGKNTKSYCKAILNKYSSDKVQASKGNMKMHRSDITMHKSRIYTKEGIHQSK